MRIINSKIAKRTLCLVEISSLEDIMENGKSKIIKVKEKTANTVYLIKQKGKTKEKDSIKVLVLRNKFTNKLSDSHENIKKYLDYSDNGLEDPTYIAIEMTIHEYLQVKFKGTKTNSEINEELKNVEFDIDKKIESIVSPVDNNETLIISEKQNKVYLPYTIDELEEYARRYPADYPSLETVVKQEYMIPLNSFYKNPAHARFSETYFLVRKRERRSAIIAFIYAAIFVTKTELNPAVIAACKTQKELSEYMKCLKEDKLENFTHFKVIYDEPMSA